VWRIIAWHAVWWFGRRDKLGPKPYDLTDFYTKIFSTLHADARMDVLGLYGQLRKGSKWAKLAGRIESRWKVVRSLHGGGNVEINKIVLAQRGLGLPRQPRSAVAK